MSLTFYPHEDDLMSSSLQEKLELLMDAAERYKASILDMETKKTVVHTQGKQTTPKDTQISYNWEEMAKALRAARELPETTSIHKINKANGLTKLAEIYEVLRAAKMPKLEAVRVALANEANQLKASATQVE